jgi:hypothetical protein
MAELAWYEQVWDFYQGAGRGAAAAVQEEVDAEDGGIIDGILAAPGAILSNAYDVGKEKLTEVLSDSASQQIEQNIEEIKKNAQLLLTLNHDFFKKNLIKRITDEDLEFKNFGLIKADPTKLMNQFVRPEDFKDFLEITPLTLAKLVPTVRLFKAEYDEKGHELDSFEIRFDEFLIDPSSILENKLSRGGGIGIQSFDWSYTGTNPFESDKLIKAHLKLRLSSVEDLDREFILTSTTGNTTRFRLIDLVVPKSSKDETYEPNFLTFKAVVGFSPNFTVESKKELNIKKQLEILRRTLLLTRTTHDLEFRQDGTLILSLGFQARIDAAFDTPENDILSLFGTNIRKIEGVIGDIRTDLQKLKECGEESTEYENLKRIFEEQEALLTKRKELTYKRLLDTLMSTNRVYTVDVPLESIGVNYDEDANKYEFLNKTELGKIVDTITGDFENGRMTVRQFSGPVRRRLSGGGSTTTEKADSLEADLNNQIIRCIAQGDGTFEIPFIYLGDLIEAALIPFNLDENPYNKDLRVFLGTGTYKFKNKNPVTTFQLSHIPISLDLFMDWFIDTIYRPQLSSFPLKNFLVSVTANLLAEALKTEELQSANVPIFSRNIITTTLELPSSIASKPVIDLDTEKISIHSAALLKNNVSCYLIASRNTFEVSSKENVPHLTIGQDRGLVKNIDYKRTEQPFLREVAMNHNESDTFARIAEPYKATIKMIGNNLFYPGQTVFLNPTPSFPSGLLQGSKGQLVKIRGIFMITKVENFIETGKFETIITATWIGWGDGSGSLILGSTKTASCDSLKLSESIREKFKELGQEIIVDDAAIIPSIKNGNEGNSLEKPQKGIPVFVQGGQRAIE